MTSDEIEQAVALVEALCIRFEGTYLRPYICPAGVATIGIGSTRYLDGSPVRMTDPPITRVHALILLREKIRRTFMPGVLALCPGIRTPGQLAAVTDLAYNIGLGALKASTLRKRINAGRWAEVPDQFRRWNKGGGRVLPGLVRRREAEIRLL